MIDNLSLMTLLTTSRLNLEYATKKDALFLFQLMNEPSYIKNIGDRNIKTITDAETFITDRFIKSYQDNGYGYYIIKLKDYYFILPLLALGIVKKPCIVYIQGFLFILFNCP